ncbi:ATP synthase subunit g, mitochondrial [Spodoptera frugiperda]|uniref:ATP synthase subunit g, mitochondrial n=1 Tax=Spodoptera frugiperda TaxID=7108 RepID=A0A9R0EG12_SPOFR|nr:ATP synthase subunit g, mitochondrial [Spodoptera frugiperda]
MAFSLNVSRFTNVLRSRLALMTEITDVYRPHITIDKEKLIGLIKEKAEAAAKSELAKKMKVLKGFYVAEFKPPLSLPPRPAELNKLLADLKLTQEFFKNKCYLYITVRQAWLLFLVCFEVWMWFFIGETIGKRHLVGYKV